ncbi:hypothetical protein [Kitasatospora kifunensis]|uniref:Uncharacterized protein n=1 Tax=Kitasatospora kifunensis TaxID=58351 RepID=A0A7W7VZI9_KITKI|nr:hypothetical protein [Kitasatospora kifunensis]MBB4928138.1 hypothetical protein [Kitasatospora kifunensis]
MERIRTLALAGAASVLALGLSAASAHASETDQPLTDTKPAATEAADAPLTLGSWVSIPAHGHGVATASCPTGTFPTVGNWHTSAYDIYATDYYRSGNTWYVLGTNMGTTTEYLEATVTCLTT